MTSIPHRSSALDGIIAPWAMKIATLLGAIVEFILTSAENIRNSLPQLGVCRNEAGRRLSALRPGLSRSPMSRLGFPRPLVSALHAVARERLPDLRARSEAREGFCSPSRVLARAHDHPCHSEASGGRVPT